MTELEQKATQTMSLEYAVEILNRNDHNGCEEWTLLQVTALEAYIIPRGKPGHRCLSLFETLAIAHFYVKFGR